MPDSERVTWEECPGCRQPAAVGWWHGRPVEFDCPRGCQVSLEQLELFTGLQISSTDRAAL